MPTHSNARGLLVSVPEPSPAELDAGEAVLAEAHGHAPDGYWRTLVSSVLEAAKDAQLREVLAQLDAEIDMTQRALVGLRSKETPASLVSDVGGEDFAFDLALGNGRR